MKTIHLVIRICSALLAAVLVATFALAVAGCAVPYVERPTAEVVLVPVEQLKPAPASSGAGFRF